MTSSSSRRRFLRLTTFAMVAGPGAGRALAAPVLKDGDTEAAAIEYVSDARKVDRARFPHYQPGQSCANCGLYAGDKGAASGPCGIVLGKEVAAAGWCNSWEARPAPK
jgi:High potential iron-sulfur protein